MITNETIKVVKKRSGGRCENPLCTKSSSFSIFENHHIYWRSQYRKCDRDEAWNLAYLHRECHYAIHSNGDRALDTFLKRSADIRKPKNSRSTEITKEFAYAKAKRKKEYKKKIDRYKETHEGLSPSQVAYRRQKAYRASLKS